MPKVNIKLNTFLIIISFVLLCLMSFLVSRLSVFFYVKYNNLSVVELNSDLLELLKNINIDEAIANPDSKIQYIKPLIVTKTEVYKVKKGQSISDLLLSQGFERADVYSVVSSMSSVVKRFYFKDGDEIEVEFDESHEFSKKKKPFIFYEIDDGSDASEVELKPEQVDAISRKKINSVSFKLSFNSKVLIEKDNDTDGFISKKQALAVTMVTKKVNVVIRQSLFEDLIKEGVPSNIVINIINMYSYELDFQRDIKEGDSFFIIFEEILDTSGKKVKDGNILYSRYSSGFRDIEYFFFSEKKQHYDISGKSLKKNLIKTPINGARITSKFGYRKHPILGYSKIHRGTDFAAPKGTPIFAAGDGTVVYRGFFGSYGNYVKIRHNSSSYSTAYAHMSRFAKSIRVGAKVKQGQVIGYVGTTGRSTGSHLHYEILKNGDQINPNLIVLSPSSTLSGEDLKKFSQVVNEIKN